MKIEKTIERQDGSIVKIVAELFVSISGVKSISNWALTKSPVCKDWVLHTSDPIPRKWKGIDDYMANGRPKMLRIVSIAEVLKINQELLVSFESCINAASSSRLSC